MTIKYLELYIGDFITAKIKLKIGIAECCILQL